MYNFDMAGFCYGMVVVLLMVLALLSPFIGG